MDNLSFLDPAKNKCDYVELEHCPGIDIKATDLTMIQLNIRGLINKQHELLKLINSCTGKSKLDVVTLQETWLTSRNESLIDIPGYKHYGMKRSSRLGGGVSILVNKILRSRPNDTLSFTETDIESCFIEIDDHGSKILVGSIYRPPNSNINCFLSRYKEISKSLKKFKGHCLIGMDHNLDFLKAGKHATTQSFVDLNLDIGLFPNSHQTNKNYSHKCYAHR